MTEGEQASADLSIENLGGSTLALEGITWFGTSVFQVEDVAGVEIEAGDALDLTVAYSPSSARDEGTMLVHSDDPDEETVSVELTGRGLFPALTLDDEQIDMPQAYVGCSSGAGLAIRNDGDGVATISEVLVDGAPFSLTDTDPFPWTIAPGASVDLDLGFSPEVEGDYEGEVVIVSDDPSGPLVGAVTGSTLALEQVRDRYWQGPIHALDLIITVDQSGSMANDIERLGGQFEALIALLGEAELDYQIGVVTADTGCVNDTIFDATTTDGAARFAAAVAGEAGIHSEDGFTLAQRALEAAVPGGCNDGLLRDGARTSVIFVSDEPEQSGSYAPTHIATLQSEANALIMHAIAGPVPDGCATAYAGERYDEAVSETMGAFLSICDDWAASLVEVVAASNSIYRTSFPLSDVPDPDTVAVTVDGAAVSTWRYVEADNSVAFSALEAPAAGALVEVQYEAVGTCDE